MAAKKTGIKEQLGNILSAAEAPRVLLIISPDCVRMDRILDSVLATFFKDRQIEPTTFHGEEIRGNSLDGVNESVQSVGLFSPVSATLVQKIEHLSATRTGDLLKIAKAVPQGVSLLLTASKLPASNKLKAYCTKQDCLLELQPLKGAELSKWITKELKKEGISQAPQSVIAGIATLANGSLDIAAAIIAHCSLYSSGGKISHREFELLYPEAPEQNEFELIDLLQQGSAADVEIALERLWLNGKNAFMFLGLLTRTYSRYVTIRTLLDQGLAPGIIRTKLGMKEWMFNKHLHVARKKSFHRLHSDMRSLLLADSKLKNRSLGTAEVIAEVAQALRR